jgi:hypothetical protein
MDIRQIFLDLTEYTIPYRKDNRYEKTLEKYLPKGYKTDSVGNYYVEVGTSETLFTTHLDTYCKEYEKVNHVIEGDIIKTDGTTILGGDNKLGMTILLYMIEQGIPGTYYFFLGEEPIISGGLWGSQNALSSNTEFFKKFKRAVAFDRKQTGSVVTRQKARPCCSNEFADEVISDQIGIAYDVFEKLALENSELLIDTPVQYNIINDKHEDYLAGVQMTINITTQSEFNACNFPTV